MSEQNHAVDSSVHYNIPELQSTPGRSKPHPHPPSSQPHLHPPSSQPNGQHCPPQPSHQEISADESEEEDEEDDTEEDEPSMSRWQGIEAIYEAYQEYTEGKICGLLGTTRFCCMMDMTVLVTRGTAQQIPKLGCAGVCDAKGRLRPAVFHIKSVCRGLCK